MSSLLSRLISLRYSAFLLSLVVGIGLVADFHLPPEKNNLLHAALKDSAQLTEIQPVDLVWNLISQVSQDRVLADLRRLSGEEPLCTQSGCLTIRNRETGSEGLQWAKDYVTEQLVSLGYNVEIQDWSMQGYADQNLIVRRRGITFPNEEIVFIAHLDGYLNNNPAADDDATGVVSLLELARVLSGISLSRSVVLIFSTGEEHGSLGSRSYVDQLTSAQLDSIKYVISVEMLGYDSNNDGAMEFWSGDQPIDFALLLSDILAAYRSGLTPEIVTGCN